MINENYFLNKNQEEKMEKKRTKGRSSTRIN